MVATKKLSLYAATMLAEEGDDSDPRYYEAWQLLVDTGMAWRLQGWFGRTAVDLINAGLIQEKQR